MPVKVSQPDPDDRMRQEGIRNGTGNWQKGMAGSQHKETRESSDRSQLLKLKLVGRATQSSFICWCLKVWIQWARLFYLFNSSVYKMQSINLEREKTNDAPLWEETQLSATWSHARQLALAHSHCSSQRTSIFTLVKRKVTFSGV